MNLLLRRNPTAGVNTFGMLYVDDKPECFTLEDAIREQKIPGRTCIPAGKYELIVSFSNRFNRLMPLLLNVPGFEGVRIHPGNTTQDTEGCILVGRGRTDQYLSQSRVAYDALFPKLKSAAEVDKVWIEILNPQPGSNPAGPQSSSIGG